MKTQLEAGIFMIVPGLENNSSVKDSEDLRESDYSPEFRCSRRQRLAVREAGGCVSQPMTARTLNRDESPERTVKSKNDWRPIALIE